MVEASTPHSARTVGIVGGTGKLGLALAVRLASAGHPVVIGSRVPSRAVDAAATLSQDVPATASTITGAENSAACAAAEVVIVAVPYDGLDAIVSDIAPSIGDRIVVSAVVPMRFVRGEGAAAVDVPAGSAAEHIARELPSAHVVGALQTISYVTLRDVNTSLDSDIVLTGDDDAAKAIVADLLAGLRDVRMIDGGGLRSSRFVEQLAVLLVSINARHRRHSGVRITDLPDDVVAAHWNALAG